MRPLIALSALTLVYSGCVAAPPVLAEPVVSQATERVAADNPNCRDYTAQAIVDGHQQQIVGRACYQSDGSWRIAEGPPGQPSQFQTVYPPPSYAYYPYYPYYPYYDPWFLGPPIGLSFGGSFVFVDRFHHFHRFDRAFAHDGFHRDGFRAFAHDGFHHNGFHHNGFNHDGFGHFGFGHGMGGGPRG